ncbi:MAG TPA: sialidase family protein [bacterium]|nr:sialidase family protein [bacterium]
MRIEKQGFIFEAEKRSSTKKVCTFTSLFRHSSGKIFSSFRLGTRKDSTDGNGVILASSLSTDWTMVFSNFKNEFNGHRGDIKVVELFERPDGNISAFLSWFDCSKSKKLYDASSDTIQDSKLILVDSFDMGKTWENYKIVDTQNLPGPALTGRVLRTYNGYFAFFESYGPEKPGLPSSHAAHAIFSSDGINFTKIVTVARHPENELYYWDQRNAYDTATGNIITMFWTYNRMQEKDIDIHISFGNPETFTWSVPAPTGIKGQIAAPIPLPDGRLLCFYVHRHYPGSMRLVMSPDSGKTWKLDEELIIYQNPERREKISEGKSSYAEYWEDMNTWSFGHPCGILLDKNLVLVAYYAGKDVSCLSARYAIISV